MRFEPFLYDLHDDPLRDEARYTNKEARITAASFYAFYGHWFTHMETLSIINVRWGIASGGAKRHHASKDGTSITSNELMNSL